VHKGFLIKLILSQHDEFLGFVNQSVKPDKNHSPKGLIQNQSK